MPSIPTVQLIYCAPLPSSPSGEENQCFPFSTHSCQSGAHKSTPEPGRSGGSSGKQFKDTGPGTIWPLGHSPLPPLGGLAKLGVQRSCLLPTSWGGGGALIPHYMHFSFQKEIQKKKAETSGQRRKIPSVHTVTRSLYGKENIQQL